MNVLFINRLKYCLYIIFLVFIQNSFAMETQPLYLFPDKWHVINKFGFTTNGEIIVVAGRINYKNTICFYDLQTKKIKAKIEFDGTKPPVYYSLSDDGNTILVGYSSFYVWADLYDVNTSVFLQKFGPHNYPPFDKRVNPMIIQVSLSPVMKWALTSTPTESYGTTTTNGYTTQIYITHIWDTETGKNVNNIQAISSIMPFVDENRVFIGDKLYDVVTGNKIMDLATGCSYPHSILSLDKKWLVIPGCRNLSTIWDWITGIKVKELPITTTRVFLSPDNKYLADCFYGIRIWDVDNEKIIKNLDLQYLDYVFSPDWKYMLTYDYHDSPTGYSSDDYHIIYLWRVEDLFQVTGIDDFENY